MGLWNCVVALTLDHHSPLDCGLAIVDIAASGSVTTGVVETGPGHSLARLARDGGDWRVASSNFEEAPETSLELVDGT